MQTDLSSESQSGRFNILLVGDNDTNINLIRYLLSGQRTKYDIDVVKNLTRAFDILKKDEHDAVLVFHHIQGRSGTELISKAAPTSNKPFIFVCDKENPKAVRDAYLAGASDHIITPFANPDMVDRAVRYAVAQKKLEVWEKEKFSRDKTIKILQLLSDTGAILSSSFEYSDTLQQVTDLVVTTAADWCIVDIFDNSQINMVAYSHVIPAKRALIEELRENFPANEKAFLSPYEILKKGVSVCECKIDDVKLKNSAKNNKHLNILKRLGVISWAMIPISVRGKVVGVLTLVSGDSGSLLDNEDLPLFEELAHRIGNAVDNASLYHQSKQSEDIFKRLAQSDMVGIAIINFNGQVLGANDLVLKTFGYERSDVESKRFNWTKMYPPEYYPFIEESRKTLFEKGQMQAAERELLHKEGHRVPVLIGSILLNKRMGTVLAFIIDITQQKEIERQKDEFISIASHELKTPLTSQKLFLELMKRSLAKGKKSELNKHLNHIEVQNDKLLKLVQELLDVSRIEAGRMALSKKSSDLDQLIGKVTENFSETSGRVIEVKGNLKTVFSFDPSRIEQVLTNLIANAVKYSPEDKKVIVSVRKNGSDAEVCVQDFGIGISQENQDRLFRRFQRVVSKDKSYPGFGLGLYIASEIVKAHNGDIWVNSAEGKGSTFCFKIPLI